jgi:hypothetical protein
MIRVDAVWLSTEPMDTPAGPALARVVKVFGAAWPHHACVEAAGLRPLGTRLMNQLGHARRQIDGATPSCRSSASRWRS